MLRIRIRSYPHFLSPRTRIQISNQVVGSNIIIHKKIMIFPSLQLLLLKKIYCITRRFESDPVGSLFLGTSDTGQHFFLQGWVRIRTTTFPVRLIKNFSIWPKFWSLIMQFLEKRNNIVSVPLLKTLIWIRIFTKTDPNLTHAVKITLILTT